MIITLRPLLRLLAAMLIAPAAAAHAQPGLPDCDAGEVATAGPERVELGRDLFYDPILSGNRTVACATCHHPEFATSDGVALSLGDGGIGLGPDRRVDPANVPEQRIPRNAQALFNLGYPEFSVMFHDGRVERLPNGMIRTPLGEIADDRPLAVLTAQAAFPVLSADEMAGHYTENEIAKAVRLGLIEGQGGAHDLLARRVAAIPAYRGRF
ncbi:MAG: cytochrome-c peroxidase, partial [Pseudomonadota bacterium]